MIVSRKWRQYSIRSLLLITVLVAICCSWLACVRKEYVDQLKFAGEIADRGALVQTIPGSRPWLNYLLGNQINREVVHVRFTNECIAPEALEKMPLLFALEAFDAEHTDLDDDDLKWLAKTRRLEHVNLSGTHITDRAVSYLVLCPKLAELCLEDTAISNAGLEQLSRVKTLSHLDLTDSKVTDDGLGYLEDLPQLRELDLGGPGITDKAAMTLGKLRSSLINLMLWKAAITDNGYTHLCQQLPNTFINSSEQGPGEDWRHRELDANQ
jgi:hypothetical protein